jgi:dTDP-4-dehydrorhamnose reductase
VDHSDADDLYGKTKFLGEVAYPNCLTIRTSIIGRELSSGHGLIDWFLRQEGKTISGYKKAIFSGLTTIALAKIIGQIISDYPELQGILQIASKPISKFDLLILVKKIYRLKIIIEPDETVINDRSLNADKFRKKTNIKIPSWEYMIKEMYRDPTPYATIRGNHA